MWHYATLDLALWHYATQDMGRGRGRGMRIPTRLVAIKTHACTGAREEPCHVQAKARCRLSQGMGKGKARARLDQVYITTIIRHCASA